MLTTLRSTRSSTLNEHAKPPQNNGVENKNESQKLFPVFRSALPLDHTTAFKYGSIRTPSYTYNPKETHQTGILAVTETGKQLSKTSLERKNDLNKKLEAFY